MGRRQLKSVPPKSGRNMPAKRLRPAGRSARNVSESQGFFPSPFSSARPTNAESDLAQSWPENSAVLIGAMQTKPLQALRTGLQNLYTSVRFRPAPPISSCSCMNLLCSPLSRRFEGSPTKPKCFQAHRGDHRTSSTAIMHNPPASAHLIELPSVIRCQRLGSGRCSNSLRNF